MAVSEPYADSGGDWALPQHSGYAPTSSATAPLASGSSFLSGIGGIASGLGGLLSGGGLVSGALGAVTGLANADKDPAQTLTGTSKQSGTFTFSNPFQVGGKGNALTADATATGAPADASGGSAASPLGGINGNTILIVAAAVITVGLLVFGLRPRK